MLQGQPTKNGTGISIFGDYGDLANLYEIVHEIARSRDEYNERLKAQNQLLMNFAYEIRKAYSGQRLQDKFTYSGDEIEYQYYGFQVVWTDILIFISVLRHNAGYIQTDKFQQANLYMLEHIVEKALFDYDPEGANQIKEFIGQRINITDKHAFLIYQALHIKFVTEKSGKRRFRKIPALIGSHFSEWKDEYKQLINSLQISAKEQNCDILELEFNNFPDIKW